MEYIEGAKDRAEERFRGAGRRSGENVSVWIYLKVSL